MTNFIQKTDFIQSLISWTLFHGIKVVVIILGAQVLTKIGKTFISRTMRRFVQLTTRNHEAEKKREDTLIAVFSGLLRFTILVVALLMILPEFGIDAGPLLAGAGLMGLAVGMASRSLIQDYISGIFIILEDQYRVGDLVEIGGVEGTVKDINLRRTILEDKEGTEYFIPNGQVKISSNKSR